MASPQMLLFIIAIGVTDLGVLVGVSAVISNRQSYQ